MEIRSSSTTAAVLVDTATVPSTGRVQEAEAAVIS